MDQIVWQDFPPLRNPVVLSAFEGWGDAGEAASGSIAFLLGEIEESQTLARIDPDEFYDFQARRPVVEITDGGTRSIRWPRIEILGAWMPSHHHDLIAIMAEEPNLKWKAFSELLIDAFRELGANSLVTVGAFLGQVAHTVPVPLIGVSNDKPRLDRHGLMYSGYQGPTGMTGVLNHAGDQAGMDVISIWAAVPHYLANHPNPAATHALVTKIAEVLDLDLSISQLQATALAFMDKVSEAVEASSELGDYVKDLESSSHINFEHDAANELVEEIEEFLQGGPDN